MKETSVHNGSGQANEATTNAGGACIQKDAMDAVFSCKQLNVEYKRRGGQQPRSVLTDVNLVINDGEFVALLGGSGVGKSTLLRVLGGLQSAGQSSKVLYRSVPIDGPPSGVIMVFQDYAASLLSWRTVERNVALGLEGRVEKEEIRHRVEAALELVGLSVFAKEHPWELSGGMQQRVQIARALVMQPRALLMDEPFGALDAMTRSALQDSLLAIQRQAGTTTVFVTHDVDEALYLADRVIVLTGSPASIRVDIRTDLPLIRNQVATRELPRYLELRRQIMELIGQGSS